MAIYRERESAFIVDNFRGIHAIAPPPDAIETVYRAGYRLNPLFYKAFESLLQWSPFDGETKRVKRSRDRRLEVTEAAWRVIRTFSSP